MNSLKRNIFNAKENNFKSESSRENEFNSFDSLNKFNSHSESGIKQRKVNAKDRKTGGNFRSVWYDGSDGDSAAGTFGSLRKATSFDDLLVINNRKRAEKYPKRSKLRRFLSKEMISSPLRCEKLLENWREISPASRLLDHLEVEEEIEEAEEEARKTSEQSDPSISRGRLEIVNFSIDQKYVKEEKIGFETFRRPISMDRLEKANFSNPADKKSDTASLSEDKIKNDVEKGKIEDGNFDSTVDSDGKPSEQVDSSLRKSITDVIACLDDCIEQFQAYQSLASDEAGKIGIEAGTVSNCDENGVGCVFDRNRKVDADVFEDVSNSEPRNLVRMKKFSASNVELLKTFNTNKTERPDFRKDRERKFPVHENEDVVDVQIRKHSTIQTYRFSKTLDFDSNHNKNKTKDFDVKIAKLQISNEKSAHKFKKDEILRYLSGSFLKHDEKNFASKVLRSNVSLKSAKLVGKQVEFKDSIGSSFALHFDSSKEAKQFSERDNVRPYLDEEKSSITKTLKRLLGKRQSREVLEKRGIYKDEPIFGNTLGNLHKLEGQKVPRFIVKAMELIESESNVKSLGLYRTSGNLATIQKIRFEVDKGNLDVLDDYVKDVDVLTGSLKLFFRELKEPLISCKVCEDLLGISDSREGRVYSKKDKEQIKSILGKLPVSHLETLHYLIRHLLRVVQHKDDNKMDTYNLSVCWGPTIIFVSDLSENVKDIITQSTDASRLFDALLCFYVENPEELDDKKEYFDSNKNAIERYDSKDSLGSSDSCNSKTHKKNGSNASLNVDDVIKKAVELIEGNPQTDGLYQTGGSSEKVAKITRKMSKKKCSELEKYKCDVYDMAESLKKYLKDMHEPLTSAEVVEQVLRICDNSKPLEQTTRNRVAAIVESHSKRDAFVFLIGHVIKVIRNETFQHIAKNDMVKIWSRIFNHNHRIAQPMARFEDFLKILIDVYDGSKESEPVTPKSLTADQRIRPDLLNDLKKFNKDKDKDKDRCISRYDNVDDLSDPASFDEKADFLEVVENTKL